MADEAFYPVLMSTDKLPEKISYKAKRIAPPKLRDCQSQLF